MTLTAETPLPAATAADLLAEVRAERSTRDAAEVRILLLALAWAERHITAPPAREPEPVSWLEEQPAYGRPTADVLAEKAQTGLPELSWDAPASLAAALAMSTASGRRLLRDALTLSLRLPRTFARVVAGEIPVWRARRVADAAVGHPSDVVTYLDQQVAPIAEKVGLTTLDRIIDAAMLAMYPEQREAEQLADLDARYVKLHQESMNHTGIADMSIRGDWADLAAFNDTIAEIATIIGREGGLAEHEPLDVRRSIAVGILADPARALALLASADNESAGDARATRARALRLVVHLTEANLLGLDPVATDTEQRAHLDTVIRGWAARADTTVQVQPITHCGGCADCDHDVAHSRRDVYTPSRADLAVVHARDRQCQFPYCHRPAEHTDCDHRIPFNKGGRTCPCNLSPLCRHHHRLKTFAGWTYTAIEPGVYLWTDRYGQQFLRTRDGTSDLIRE